MIFRILFILSLFALSLLASDYKYKLVVNNQCVFHGFESNTSKNTSDFYAVSLCDGFAHEDEPVFLISTTLAFGKVFYLDSFSSQSSFFYGFAGGVGEAELMTYGGSRVDATYLEAGVLAGYERELYKGFIMNVGVTYHHYYTLESFTKLNPNDREESKHAIGEFEKGNSLDNLEPFVLFGIAF